MYLRFTTTQMDEISKKPQGVFTAAYALLASGELSKDEWLGLRAILDWYVVNLKAPPDNFYASRAIFWFRSDASECISRMWELVFLLRRHGCFIEVRKCTHLRNITYRDDLQVAAFPSELDGRITIS